MARSPHSVTIWEQLELDNDGRPHEELFVELLNKLGSLEKLAEHLKCSVSTVNVKYRELEVLKKPTYTLPDYIHARIAQRQSQVPA